MQHVRKGLKKDDEQFKAADKAFKDGDRKAPRVNYLIQRRTVGVVYPNFGRSILGCIKADFLQAHAHFAACFEIYKIYKL